MTPPPEPDSLGAEHLRTGLSFCEHCNLLGVSAVISAELETQNIIYCQICALKFYFFTEGNRIIVTKIEPL
jgi:hypothetical protein